MHILNYRNMFSAYVWSLLTKSSAFWLYNDSCVKYPYLVIFLTISSGHGLTWNNSKNWLIKTGRKQHLLLLLLLLFMYLNFLAISVAGHSVMTHLVRVIFCK